MNEAPSCKCVVSFMWTNAIVVGALVFLMFSFIDPADIAVRMMLDIDEGLFRIEAYAYTFGFMWLLFNATTFLNCYFSRLKQDKQLQSKHHLQGQH